MNPHMQFLDRGRKFKCCFCGSLTPTPVDYVCNTGVDGRRHDANDRAELCRGSVDFIASQEYMVSHQYICSDFTCSLCRPGFVEVSENPLSDDDEQCLYVYAKPFRLSAC